MLLNFFSFQFQQGVINMEEASNSPEKIKVLIDTDIGTDVDDAYAVVYAEKHPLLEVVGYTTVSGNAGLRAKILDKLLATLNIEKPIVVGKSSKVKLSQADWVEHYKPRSILNLDAVNFILESCQKFRGELILVPIGPLTNLAEAYKRDPDTLKMCKRIVMMGGAYKRGYLGSRFFVARIEYNIKCDVEAAQVIFSSGIPITMVGLDVTYNLKLPKIKLHEYESSNKPELKALAELNRLKNKNLPGIPTIMYDVLAVMEIAEPICKIEPIHLLIKDNGLMIESKNQNDHFVDVCIGVDKSKFFQRFYSILES